MTRKLMLWSALFASLAAVPPSTGQGAEISKSSLASDAATFGTLPVMWGVELSPSGEKISALQMHASGVPIAAVVSLSTGKTSLLAASEKDRFDLTWCRWANDERLLCGYRGVAHDAGDPYYVTRLIGVDVDGSDMKVLMQRQLRDEFAQFQDRIIDYLPDDPHKVLVIVPDEAGSGVDELDIRTGRLDRLIRSRADAFDWMTDGTGRLRIRMLMDEKGVEWQFRRATGNDWHPLREFPFEAATPTFSPIGFGEDPDQLLVFESHDGRIALLSMNLSRDDPEPTLVYGRPDVDLAGVVHLGRQQRLVGVQYATDKLHTHYFDRTVGKIRDDVGAALPGQAIDVLGESWDRRFYLLHASSDRDAGTYYRYDAKKHELLLVIASQPRIKDRQLAAMKPVHHPAADGREIPGYLTLPAQRSQGQLPVVILPHGGPESRDIWGYDWLPQFFAARGYAVLQSNFRGSGGFGEEWAGDGGFKAWHLAISDIDSGAQWLIDEGIADPERMCIVGWSFGGYAALMSAIERPSRYRCVVSIAGVTDPRKLIEISGLSGPIEEFVGRDPEVLKRGSPKHRARELMVPVLLFHGDEDVNVDVGHSRALAKALRNEGRSVELIEFDDAEHSIWNSKDRIEMLERIGAFLDQHTKPTTSTRPADGS